MSNADYSNIHRYLDEAFAQVAMTAETQDLKEEIRGNLSARVVELQAQGMGAAEAATAAIDELGDIHELVEQLESGEPTARPASPANEMLKAYLVNKVRPKPGFVIRTVALSIVTAVAIALVVLGVVGVLGWTTAVLGPLALVAVALPAGLIVGDSLRQKTSHNFPLPNRRAVSYGASSLGAVAGLTLLALFIGFTGQLWLIVAGVLLLVAAAIAFTALGVTQTNRKKPWSRAAAQSYQMDDRFTQDPVAAARFGIYTAVIWVLAFAAFVVLSFTIGFAWSWLALLLGLAVFMFVLARMLFPSDTPKHQSEGQDSQQKQ
jgi:peptidoglycan/LPS O-acetylase OafA/YrhL